MLVCNHRVPCLRGTYYIYIYVSDIVVDKYLCYCLCAGKSETLSTTNLSLVSTRLYTHILLIIINRVLKLNRFNEVDEHGDVYGINNFIFICKKQCIFKFL